MEQFNYEKYEGRKNQKMLSCLRLEDREHTDLLDNAYDELELELEMLEIFREIYKDILDDKIKDSDDFKAEIVKRFDKEYGLRFRGKK